MQSLFRSQIAYDLILRQLDIPREKARCQIADTAPHPGPLSVSSVLCPL